MSDLETRLRDALRSDEIGWDDLRQPTLRVASRTPRRWPTVLATAAAVVVVAGVAVGIALTRGGSTGPAAAPGYAGYTWRVTAVTDRRGPVPDAASVPAQIAFSDTAVSGTVDGASMFGHYQATRQGYELTFVGNTFPLNFLTTAKSRTKMRIDAAVMSVFIRYTKNLGGPLFGQRNAVAARVSGDQLVLHANRATLQLSRVGPSRLSPMIDAVGYKWRVEALTDEHGQLTIPQRLNATLGFDSSGAVLGKDTVNNLFAGFRLTSDGYFTRLSGVPRRAAGYAGQDPAVVRLKAAVDAMVGKQAAVTASVDGDTMTLHRNGITLSLQRGTRMREPSPYSISSSGAASSAPRASHITATPAPPPSPRNSASTSPVRHARGAAGSPH